MAFPSRGMMAAIAATRFGLGARPGELAEAALDPQGWLAAQVRGQGADMALPNTDLSAARVIAYREFQMANRERRREADGDGKPAEPSPATDPAQILRRQIREGSAVDFLSRAQLGAETPASFRERWTLFWANHFAVSGTKGTVVNLVGPFEQEVIRPRVFGRFEDMLVASSIHPAMLLYLDQVFSIGPNSRTGLALARRPNAQRRGGLNENLAREILELHTVGVNGGYTQADVTEFARCLTGWSIGAPREPERAGRFVFREPSHEPGPRTIMGRRFAEDGVQQGVAVLKVLASHPSTARHLCTKIARHFTADQPPPRLVAALEKAWLASGGDLAVVARSLIASDEAWDPAPAKLKTPYELIISGYRTFGTRPAATPHIVNPLNAMGQRAFAPPSPKGWPDEAAFWAPPDALIKRMTWAERFAAVADPAADPKAVAASALGERLTPKVATAIARAESRREALALLLMSPEFQRR